MKCSNLVVNMKVAIGALTQKEPSLTVSALPLNIYSYIDLTLSPKSTFGLSPGFPIGMLCKH